MIASIFVFIGTYDICDYINLLAEEGEIEGLEPALQVYKFEQGYPDCVIGFLAKRYVKNREIYANRILQVVKDLRCQSSTSVERQKSYRLNGLVHASVLN
jgi:hypothetical protein